MEVLASLKKGKNPPLVIIFTNYPYLQYRKKCLDVGADFFFYKATEFERLADLLKQLDRSGRNGIGGSLSRRGPGEEKSPLE